jgi:hypothetical protein
MQAGFNEFAERIIHRLLPDLETLAIELRAGWPQFNIETFSHRHADVVHSLGLWCAAPGHDFRREDDSRGIIINVTGVSSLSVRGFVQWNRTCMLWSWRYRRFLPSTAFEYMTPLGERDEEGIIRNAPRLYEALRQAMHRGSAPGWLRRICYRLRGEIDG